MVTVLLLVVLALVFDFLNGFHDSANSIATVVSTRVLTPRQAVVWAASFNFIAFLFFGLHVANTIGKDIIASLLFSVGLLTREFHVPLYVVLLCHLCRPCFHGTRSSVYSWRRSETMIGPDSCFCQGRVRYVLVSCRVALSAEPHLPTVGTVL